MPDGYTFTQEQSFDPAGPARRLAALDGRIAILSIAPARKLCYLASVLIWAGVHALLLGLLLGGAPSRTVPADEAAFEMIVLADDPQPGSAQEAPPVMAAVEPATPPDVESPIAEPVEVPTPPAAEPAQRAVPTPPAAASQAASPEDAVAPTATVVPTVTPKWPRRATPRPVVPHRDAAAHEAPPLVVRAEARPAPQRVVTTMTTRPPGTAQTEQRTEETLRGRIREAVQAAVRCPAAARMMGLSGKASVAFDYRDGAVIGGVQLSRSTGTPMLDAAALAAVRDAHYPNAPTEMANHLLRLLVWVEEACST